MLKWLMDAMQANKLNVLHLHLSDFCRYAVESKAFPGLTTNLTGLQAGFYTREDVADIVQYAKMRGIRGNL
jgi:hexosaminidase